MFRHPVGHQQLTASERGVSNHIWFLWPGVSFWRPLMGNEVSSGSGAEIRPHTEKNV